MLSDWLEAQTDIYRKHDKDVKIGLRNAEQKRLPKVSHVERVRHYQKDHPCAQPITGEMILQVKSSTTLFTSKEPQHTSVFFIIFF